MQPADLDRGPHPLVLVRRRHANVHDREIRIVLGDDGQQRLRVADPRNDGVAGVFEEPSEALTQEHGVLGDHDSHGIATSTVVPSPSGLSTANVPPCAATRSRSPASPDPRRTTAPPTPSSDTVTWSLPLSWVA